MSGPIEAQLGKVAAQAAARLLRQRLDARRSERRREQVRPLVPVQAADRLVDELSAEQIRRLDALLSGPDFEHLALQLVLVVTAQSTDAETLRAGIRDELRECLRHAIGLSPDLLLGITDTIYAGLDVACVQACEALGRNAWILDNNAAAVHGHLAAMAARNVRLLQRIADLAGVHRAADRLRRQVGELHARLRLPHTGTSRSVEWEELYVPPVLTAEPTGSWTPDLDLLTEPTRRTVVLGDPGAGKSTLAARLAYRTATADDGRVPFLVVLRDLTEELRRPGRTLAELLTLVAKDPYHIELSADEVEYLLCNGRAVVFLDGLDELTDIGLRQRVVQLVNGFASQFPLVPTVVTARRVGYLDAPLMTSLFHTATIAPMDDEQVHRYAVNWFALDDSTSPPEQERLRDAFLRESESIKDLRSNALLLSLLCAMYGTEQYLPRNRAQIYERCAVMVFERWDSMRGIAMPLRFHGYVRGAVQELAWQMFAVRDVAELPRHQVLRILLRFLVAKRFDPDEAQGLAEDFLAFCTGRAWVLAEVGATETEPLYGFAHRTFLEYFAADRLVRHHPSAEAAWEQLRPHLGDSRWTVVTQLAVQLLDRNVDSGAERLIDLGIAALAEAHDAERTAVVGFLADAAGHVALPPALIDPIVEAAYTSARDVPMDLRHRYRAPFDGDEYATIERSDGPLWTLMYDSLETNLPFVRRALGHRMVGEAEAGAGIARFLRYWLATSSGQVDAGRMAMWAELAGEIRAAYRGDLCGDGVAWLPRGDIEDPTLVGRFFDRYGPAPFFRSSQCYAMMMYPSALLMFDGNTSRRRAPGLPAAQVLRDRLLHHPMPWLPAGPWHEDWQSTGRDETVWEINPVLHAWWPNGGEDLATFLILYLPYLETAADRPVRIEYLLDIHRLTFALGVCRRDGNVMHTWPDLPDEAGRFLRRWVRREISVIG